MNKNVEKFKGFTEISTVRLSYQWVINNFSLWVPDKYIVSPTFSSVDNNELQWNLVIYPMGSCNNDKGYVSFFLNLKKRPINVRVNCKFSIFNNEKEDNIKEFSSSYVRENESHGVARFLETKNVSNFLTDNKLSVFCHIEACFGIKNSPDIIDESRNRPIHIDLKMLLDNKELTDITIIANGKEFFAHKAILAARSSVFSAMFKNNMKEIVENRIEITDFDSDILNEMLQYIYTGKVDNIEKNPEDLLAIADKYDLEELKMKCEQYFSDCLCTFNALEFLELANRNNCHALKKYVISFIVANRKEFIESAEFEKLKDSKPDLAYYLLSTMVLQK